MPWPQIGKAHTLYTVEGFLLQKGTIQRAVCQLLGESF